jgi:ankyrin repeat protein/uncharacterized protein
LHGALKKSIAGFIAAVWLAPGLCLAAGFDCNRATTLVEKLICADQGLSQLDESLSKTYKEVLRWARDPAGFKREQWKWLREVRDLCTDSVCLEKEYRNRLAVLEKLLPEKPAVDRQAHAASFDCGKAESEVEKMICSDDELSRLDESLHKAYLEALKRTDIKNQMIKSQRQWLKNERDACQNAECIRNAYEIRIKELGLSRYGIVMLRPPIRSASPSKTRPKISKSPAIELPRKAIETKTVQQHESTLKGLTKSETEPSVNEKLLRAAENGSQEKIEPLLATGGDVNAKGPYGRTVLMAAARSGNLELVKFLMEKGADAQAKSSFGNTALMNAARSGNLEVVKFLIDRRADVNAKDNGGETVLMNATRSGNVEVVKSLIDRRADVNAKDNSGETVLMNAVRVESGFPEVVRLFTDRGADVNARDKSGKTVLMATAESGNCEIAKFLINKGANVNAGDKSGKTVLMTAAEKGNCKIAEFLVDRGADVNAKDDIGRTVLMDAAWRKNLKVVKFLIDKGADVNAKDNFDRTALTTAASGKRLDVVKLLIDKGADVNAKDQNGRTALSLASAKNQPEIVRYLKAHGAKLSEGLVCARPGDEDFPDQGVLVFLNHHAVQHVKGRNSEAADELLVWNKNPEQMCFFITTVSTNFHTCSLGGKATAVRSNEYSYSQNKCNVIFIFTEDKVKVNVTGLCKDSGCGMASIDSATYKKTNKVFEAGH